MMRLSSLPVARPRRFGGDTGRTASPWWAWGLVGAIMAGPLTVSADDKSRGAPIPAPAMASPVAIAPLADPPSGQRVLLRGVGPTLEHFGVMDALPNPAITLYSDSQAVAANDDWGDASNVDELATTTPLLGGFPLAAGSRDAAILTAYPRGPYTVHLRGTGTDAGIALLELYNTPSIHARLVNLSARAEAGSGESVLIAGFTLAGTGGRTVLIRAVGPSLAQFDVPGPLADPRLTLFEGETPILSNDNWTTAADLNGLIEATSRTGAFALEANSRDAALLVTLMPGTYTAQASGVGAASGNVLIEIYAVP